MKLTKLEILENTKHIMIFMGLTPQFELATKYHKSWDWLLPVYVKASEQIVPSIMANRKINVKAANHIVIAKGYLLSGDFDNTYKHIILGLKNYNN